MKKFFVGNNRSDVVIHENWFRKRWSLGDDIKYLGVSMKVTQFTDFEYSVHGGSFYNPKMSADYVTKDGEIKTITFCVSKFHALACENL